MVELLAPAGNFEKLKTALYFGADAAYIGGKDFSLRSFADNFSREQLIEAVKYAHALGKKVYVTANIFARNPDMLLLEDYFKFLFNAGVDAAIISDSGVFLAARKAAPDLPVHISTQANLTNKYAVKFWQEQGASRVILARELSIAEISEMIAISRKLLTEAGYAPYYLYRQKYQAGGLENTGWTKPNKACLYNIDVMEEISSNVAVGANSISKRLFDVDDRIERYAVPKDIPTYISKIDKIISERQEFFK